MVPARRAAGRGAHLLAAVERVAGDASRGQGDEEMGRQEDTGIMNPYTGDNFNDFLAEEGILDEVTARAHQRLLTLQVQDAMIDISITAVLIVEYL